jgi:hypothetical protein
MYINEMLKVYARSSEKGVIRCTMSLNLVFTFCQPMFIWRISLYSCSHLTYSVILTYSTFFRCLFFTMSCSRFLSRVEYIPQSELCMHIKELLELGKQQCKTANKCPMTMNLIVLVVNLCLFGPFSIQGESCLPKMQNSNRRKI